MHSIMSHGNCFFVSFAMPYAFTKNPPHNSAKTGEEFAISRIIIHQYLILWGGPNKTNKNDF